MGSTIGLANVGAVVGEYFILQDRYDEAVKVGDCIDDLVVEGGRNGYRQLLFARDVTASEEMKPDIVALEQHSLAIWREENLLAC